jgi:hypothetical protein
MASSDFALTVHGSIVLLRPASAEAKTWCSDHLDPDALWFADAVVVESSYIDAIAEAISSANLTITRYSHAGSNEAKQVDLPEEMPWAMK